ncbi:MAG: Mur ligase domain-containing protein [Bacteroidota bacterium]|nr:Mur ligase domain-containing protein [Bacteroidota bacterium]
MDYKNLKHIYFLGIGGIGMSALARYFMHIGVSVSGYDRVSTQLTDKLQAEGMRIHFEDDPAKIPVNIDLAIITPAIAAEQKELKYLKEIEATVRKRAEVLEDLTRDHFTIAVAGTHGKTTISSMIAHVLKEQNASLCAFVGGIMTNYDSNFLYTEDGHYMIVEADEFDRSFLKLQPDFALISAVDADHLDVYGDHDELKKAFRHLLTGSKRTASY